MAEALPSIGFCLSCISLILSTVPTGVKASNSIRERQKETREFRDRLAVCQGRFPYLQNNWGNLKLEKDAERWDDIKELELQIDRTITKHMVEAGTAHTWQEYKRRWTRGCFKGPPVKEPSFIAALRYALWKKDILEAWLKRLEITLDSVDKHMEKEYRDRTAHHFDKKPGLNDTTKLRKMETFVQKLWALADELFKESKGKEADTNTYAWALDLAAHEELSDPLGLTVLPVDIVLRYSRKKRPAANEHYKVSFCYIPDNEDTHTSNNMVRKIIQMDHLNHQGLETPLFPYAKRWLQDPLARSTRTLGDLLIKQPNLFRHSSWLADRGDIIRGVCNWAILLWPTSWLAKLCCFGITVEKEIDTNSQTRPMFDVDEHSGCKEEDHNSRFRNLGLFLAQLVLGFPIRWAKDLEKPLKFEERSAGTWSEIYQSQLVQKVGMKTSSRPLMQAVEFCLEPPPYVLDKDFKPGYIFMCIDRIYKPIIEWYNVESASRRKEFHESLKKCKAAKDPENQWPEAAMRASSNAQNCVTDEISSSSTDEGQSKNSVTYTERIEKVIPMHRKLRQDSLNQQSWATLAHLNVHESSGSSVKKVSQSS